MTQTIYQVATTSYLHDMTELKSTTKTILKDMETRPNFICQDFGDENKWYRYHSFNDSKSSLFSSSASKLSSF